MNQQNQTAPQTAAPKTFTTITAAELMAQEFEPLQFAIEKKYLNRIIIYLYNSQKNL